MVKRSHIVSGLVGIVLFLVGLFIYSNLEQYTRYVDEGADLDVELNPWHAAQRYLKQFNIESHRSFNLQPVIQELNTSDTLVLANRNPIVNPTVQQQLLHWVENGGHLVITAHNIWDTELESSGDIFLDQLGIRLLSTKEESEETDIRALGSVSQADAASPAEEIEPASEDEHQQSEISGQQESASSCTFLNVDNIVQISVNGHLLQIESVSERSLEVAYDVDATTGQHFPNGIVQMPLNDGELTVLLDSSIFRDPRIGELDHAYLLWYLVKDSSTAWLVSSEDSEDLMQLLWRTAPYLLVSLLFITLVWSWQRSVRFGPLIRQTLTSHRKITEHIEASARFEWNHGQAHTLLEPLRDDIKVRVSRLCTYSYQTDNPRWIAHVAAITQTPAATVAQAMACDPPRHEQGWTHLINQLQSIRNAL